MKFFLQWLKRATRERDRKKEREIERTDIILINTNGVFRKKFIGYDRAITTLKSLE